MSRALVASALFGLAAFAAALPASAFCRSTTCTGDCARDEDECKTEGKPLFWTSGCVGYSLHEDGTINIPIKHVRPAIARSFAQWVDLECDDGFATMGFAELDDVACHRTEFNVDGPNANIVLFQDTKWKYASSDNNLAKTTVTFDEETGEILDADIEINHAYNFYTISDENVEYDLVSVVTHEVGHFIGLDHTLDPVATMNATYDRGTIDLRSLEEDDVLGACAAYPPSRDATCDTDPKGGFSGECGGTESTPGEPVEEPGGCAVAVAGAPGGGAWVLVASAGLAASGAPAGAWWVVAVGAALAAVARRRREGHGPARRRTR